MKETNNYNEMSAINRYNSISKSTRKDYENNKGYFFIREDHMDEKPFSFLLKFFKNMIIIHVRKIKKAEELIYYRYLGIGPMFREVKINEAIPVYKLITKSKINNRGMKSAFIYFLEEEE
ncbi:MAG: hypothetical protein ACTSQG_00070 [Promethearchaeota archaeon]